MKNNTFLELEKKIIVRYIFVIKDWDFIYLFQSFYNLYAINTINAPSIENILEQKYFLQ